ncbi:MAG: hypothetical protein ABW185_27245, partial [Sedimenticola sp.]
KVKIQEAHQPPLKIRTSPSYSMHADSPDQAKKPNDPGTHEQNPIPEPANSDRRPDKGQKNVTDGQKSKPKRKTTQKLEEDEQLTLAKSLINNLERKLNDMENTNKILKTELNAMTSQPSHITPHNHGFEPVVNHLPNAQIGSQSNIEREMILTKERIQLLEMENLKQRLNALESTVHKAREYQSFHPAAPMVQQPPPAMGNPITHSQYGPMYYNPVQHLQYHQPPRAHYHHMNPQQPTNLLHYPPVHFPTNPYIQRHPLVQTGFRHPPGQHLYRQAPMDANHRIQQQQQNPQPNNNQKANGCSGNTATKKPNEQTTPPRPMHPRTETDEPPTDIIVIDSATETEQSSILGDHRNENKSQSESIRQKSIINLARDATPENVESPQETNSKGEHTKPFLCSGRVSQLTWRM